MDYLRPNIEYVLGIAPTRTDDGQALWSFIIKDDGKITTPSTFFQQSIEFIIRGGQWHLYENGTVRGDEDSKYRLIPRHYA